MAKSNEKPPDITSYRDRRRQRSWRCMVYLNNDIYEHEVDAVRVGVTGESIIFYGKLENVLAIYPLHCTVVHEIRTD
jgi:hypothetical protein